MRVNPAQKTIKGPAEWFTGDVFIDLIARGEDPSRIQVGAVHFTPVPAPPGTPTASVRPSLSPKVSGRSKPAAGKSRRSVRVTSSTP